MTSDPDSITILYYSINCILHYFLPYHSSYLPSFFFLFFFLNSCRASSLYNSTLSVFLSYDTYISLEYPHSTSFHTIAPHFPIVNLLSRIIMPSTSSSRPLLSHHYLYLLPLFLPPSSVRRSGPGPNRAEVTRQQWVFMDTNNTTGMPCYAIMSSLSYFNFSSYFLSTTFSPSCTPTSTPLPLPPTSTSACNKASLTCHLTNSLPLSLSPLIFPSLFSLCSR